MGYIHSVIAASAAINATEKRMELSKLQKEFYDMLVADAEADPKFYTDCDSPEELEQFYQDLAKDIKSMNAAELRHNIKVWKDTG